MSLIPKLHDGQLRALDVLRAHRFTLLRCGRRWGKTTMLEYVAWRAIRDGAAVGWFGPNYKLTSPTYRRMFGMLRGFITSASKIDQRIETVCGSAEFWTLTNPDAGRSRSYDLVILDEASLVDGLKAIFEQSIAPTLLDRTGRAVMAGTPHGIDPESYFYEAATGAGTRWAEYHAPTRDNPLLPADEVASLQAQYPPLVYQQEYLAEFVDWRGTAFFSEDRLLDDGKPAVLPQRVDSVFAVIDSALKDTDANDGTAVIYFAADALSGHKLYVLDWDLVAVDSDLLMTWLPGVFGRLDALAAECHARRGSYGAWIEDKASGITLLQHAQRHGWPAQAIAADITAQGKDGRAIGASGPVYRGEVRITAPAYDKVSTFHGVARNHLLAQVCGFRLGVKQPHGMDLLDAFTSGVLQGLGS